MDGGDQGHCYGRRRAVGRSSAKPAQYHAHVVQGMLLERYPVYGWDCGVFRKVPLVRSGIVDGLERCPRYGVGWKGISFAEIHSRIS
jgi:hypothetical protein